MIKYLTYRGCIIVIQPDIADGKLIFYVSINSHLVIEVSDYQEAKKQAIKLIDNVVLEALPLEYTIQ